MLEAVMLKVKYGFYLLSPWNSIVIDISWGYSEKKDVFSTVCTYIHINVSFSFLNLVELYKVLRRFRMLDES